MQAFAKTDVGIMRQMNQDFCYANTSREGLLPNLFIVADGMGGHNAGDFASRFCVDKFVELVRNAGAGVISRLSFMESAIKETNEQLIVKAAENPELDGMGTTFVMCTISDENEMDVLNIGDSRLYLIDTDIRQITEDHSLVMEMVKNGEIKKEEARFHPKKNVVTRAISAIGLVIPDMFRVPVKKDDIILLCSDGLSNMIADSEIYDIINENRDDLEKTANTLVDRANRNGGRDNITVVLVKI
ncbi:MAG: Stp1/IreP family PP2C-type Ser/Thr phosphatase [Lachnospiraceae bacterium]|nr:Stp1/IreP family PP2C-type Ser/Thr phosphatase [Lachnospiraceae bacterium]